MLILKVKNLWEEIILLIFGFMIRKLRYLSNSVNTQYAEPPKNNSKRPEAKIENKLQKNLNSLKDKMGSNNDLKVHLLRFGPDGSLEGAMVFIDGLADNRMLTDAILCPLKNWKPEDYLLNSE